MAVEPEKCPTLNVALENGKPTSVSVSGVAANALGAKLIGNICFNLSAQNEIESVLVSDSEIVEAQNCFGKNIVCWWSPLGQPHWQQSFQVNINIARMKN